MAKDAFEIAFLSSGQRSAHSRKPFQKGPLSRYFFQTNANLVEGAEIMGRIPTPALVSLCQIIKGLHLSGGKIDLVSDRFLFELQDQIFRAFPEVFLSSRSYFPKGPAKKGALLLIEKREREIKLVLSQKFLHDIGVSDRPGAAKTTTQILPHPSAYRAWFPWSDKGQDRLPFPAGSPKPVKELAGRIPVAPVAQILPFIPERPEFTKCAFHRPPPAMKL
jgi:hypothetical protein